MIQRYTPQYEEMIVRWANLVAAQRFVALGKDEVFRVVEIGVGAGVTAHKLSRDLAGRRIPYQYIGIDNRSEDAAKGVEFCGKNMLFIEGESCDVSGRIPAPIHFLFIDGDHSYDGAKSDFDLFASKVPVNFLVGLHDVVYTGAKRVLADALETRKWEQEILSYEPASSRGMTPGIAILKRVKL